MKNYGRIGRDSGSSTIPKCWPLGTWRRGESATSRVLSLRHSRCIKRSTRSRHTASIRRKPNTRTGPSIRLGRGGRRPASSRHQLWNPHRDGATRENANHTSIEVCSYCLSDQICRTGTLGATPTHQYTGKARGKKYRCFSVSLARSHFDRGVYWTGC